MAWCITFEGMCILCTWEHVWPSVWPFSMTSLVQFPSGVPVAMYFCTLKHFDKTLVNDQSKYLTSPWIITMVHYYEMSKMLQRFNFILRNGQEMNPWKCLLYVTKITKPGRNVFLTYISLVSLLWDLGKQWRPRSDAAQHGIWSGSTLFPWRIFYQE